MAKRAVTYARVSGDDRGKDGRNLAGQTEMCRDYAAGRGYTVIAELQEDDRGASGADWDLPQLNRALEMARAGEFDVLIARELDRFARGLAKQLVIEQEFRRAGVEIDYVLGEYPDTPEGQLNKNIRAVIAEFERLKIKERMTRGRRLKVKAGNVLTAGFHPYGYRVAKRDGKRILEVYEPEARIIRLVFTWYVEGDGENGPLNLSAVTRRLNEMRVPTAADTGLQGRVNKKKPWGEWTRSSVHNILRNETYAGSWRYGKRSKPGRNPDEGPITVEVPAIVTREIWEAAQDRLAYNRQNARRNLKNEYLLSKRVMCGKCGLKMAGTYGIGREKLYLYYYCPTSKNVLDYAHICDAARIRADHVDYRVWEYIKTHVADPVALLEDLNEYQTRREQENAPLCERLRVVEDLITDNRAQLNRLLDLYQTGNKTKLEQLLDSQTNPNDQLLREALLDRMTRLKVTIGVLEREQAGLVTTLKERTLTQAQVQNILKFAEEVQRGVTQAEEKGFEARRRVIEDLDVQVKLAIEDGEKIVYVYSVINVEGERLSVLSNIIREFL